MITTLVILILTAGFLVWGRVRSDIISLCAMLALVLTGTVTPEEGIAGFSNPIVIMIAALFVIGGAITQTGIATKISNSVLSLAGSNRRLLFFLVMMVTIAVGLFVSNTGTVAILMPIVVSLAAKSKTDPSTLLMPLAFMSSISGMMTLIGTPPTLIVHNALIESGHEGLRFFTTLPVGLILLAMGLAMLYPLSKLLAKHGRQMDSSDVGTVKSPDELTSEYQIIDNVYRLVPRPDSPMLGVRLADLDLTKNYACTIAEVRTRAHSALGKQVRVSLPDGRTTIGANDVLYVLGEYDSVRCLAEEQRLTFLDAEAGVGVLPPKFSGKFRFNEIGLAEVVLLRNSALCGRLVKESGLRENYNVNILAIQRNESYILQDLPGAKLTAGDMLLVQGSWEDIDRLSRLESDVVVIGQPAAEASKVILDEKAPFAAIVILLMVLSMVFNWLPPVIAVLIATVLLILGGCFRSVRHAYRTINWESVVLFAAMMPLATAMENTGLSSLVSGGIVEAFQSYGTYAVFAGVMFATSLLSMFVSNTATAVLFAPIAIQAATSLGVSPLTFAIGVTVAASMCFASPFSTTPNAMVMSAGRYSFLDYIKIGLPIQLVIVVVMVGLLPLIFPF